MHTMLITSITDSSEVPSPPHPAPIVAKTNASGLAAAATSNLVSGPSARIISVHDASLAQNEDVAVAENAGLLQNPGTMSPQNTRGILLEVPMVSGTGGVSDAAGRQAGANASTVHLQWV
jgi:hypothetical protein